MQKHLTILLTYHITAEDTALLYSLHEEKHFDILGMEMANCAEQQRLELEDDLEKHKPSGRNFMISSNNKAYSTALYGYLEQTHLIPKIIEQYSSQEWFHIMELYDLRQTCNDWLKEALMTHGDLTTAIQAQYWHIMADIELIDKRTKRMATTIPLLFDEAASHPKLRDKQGIHMVVPVGCLHKELEQLLQSTAPEIVVTSVQQYDPFPLFTEDQLLYDIIIEKKRHIKPEEIGRAVFAMPLRVMAEHYFQLGRVEAIVTTRKLVSDLTMEQMESIAELLSKGDNHAENEKYVKLWETVAQH